MRNLLGTKPKLYHLAHHTLNHKLRGMPRRTLPLNITHLQLIRTVLINGNFTEAKWFDLGLKLNIDEPTLKNIESSSYSNNSHCLREVLALWLKSGGPCNGGRLSSTLKTMNEKEAADKIRKTFVDAASSLFHCYRDRFSKLELSEELIELLHNEKVISRGTVIEVESCGGYLVDDSVVIAVCTTIADDHNKLKLLITILLRFKDSKSLGQEMLDDYNERFPEELPSDSLLPHASDTSPFDMNTNDATYCKGVSPVLEDKLDQTDQVMFDRMRDILGILIHNIAPLIEAAIPSVSNLKSFLETCRPELKEELQSAGRNFDVVMSIIRIKCSVINITILEAVVNRYSVTEAGDYIVAYTHQMMTFCDDLRSLRICNNIQLKRFFASHLTCETITFTLNWNIGEQTFNDIKDLLTRAFKDLAKRVEVVKTCYGNSITITCYAPHYLMESLLVLAQNNLDQLKKEGLISLTIGYYTLYDRRAIEEEVRKSSVNVWLKEANVTELTVKDKKDAIGNKGLLYGEQEHEQLSEGVEILVLQKDISSLSVHSMKKTQQLLRENKEEEQSEELKASLENESFPTKSKQIAIDIMAIGIKSKITKSYVEKLLRDDQSYHGAASSTLRVLENENGIRIEICKEVEERLLKCPHSFRVSTIEMVSAPSNQAEAFRKGLESLAYPNTHLLFYGSKETNHVSIFNNGFSLNDNPFNDTDQGYIGKGVYLSSFPEYCAADINDTAGIFHLAYSNPVSVGTTCKLLGCIAIVGRTKQLLQKDDDTEVESPLESHWAWVRNDGEITTLPPLFFAQRYVIKIPEYVYPRFRISLTRVSKELVWFDSNLHNAENSYYVSELKKEKDICVYATSSSKKALYALSKRKDGTEYRAVTAGTGGEEHVYAMRMAGVHCHVLVFCMNENYHKQWAKKFINVQVTNSAAVFLNFATWK